MFSGTVAVVVVNLLYISLQVFEMHLFYGVFVFVLQLIRTKTDTTDFCFIVTQAQGWL
jgi:hypothetical protein